jgi:DNA-3-methyladenine glycosylase II
MTPVYWETAKAYLSTRDEILGRIINEYHGEMLSPSGDAFYTLARSIVGQQISVKAAASVWRKLEYALPQITPQAALSASEQALRECGLSAAKLRYLHALSEYFIHNDESIENWNTRSDAELIHELTSISGIGRWTAEMFLIFYLARPDVFPIADIGLQKAIFRH